MMKRRRRIIVPVFFFCLLCPAVLQAQTDEEKKILREREELAKNKTGGTVVVSEKSALELFDNTPSFGIFRDNYFVSGIPTNHGGCQIPDQYTPTPDKKYSPVQNLPVPDLHAKVFLGYLRQIEPFSG